jgi:predicted nucleic acid-binding protein
VIIPDVNLLVYAYNSDAPRHERAKDWWQNAIRSHQAIGMPWAVASPVITDAHIAALAVENQAWVHSNDSDFARFPGLRWTDPLERSG